MSDISQLLASLLGSAAREQPTGRLDKEESADHEHATWDKLDCERDSPLHDTGCKSLQYAIVDEKADETTDLPADLVDTDSLATSRSGGRFQRCKWG